MTKGRPSLEDNPHAGRMLIRNFIEKHGIYKLKELVALGLDKDNSKSSIARELTIGFGTVSRIYDIVFKINRRSISVDKDTRDFMRTFYEVEI